MFAKHTTRMVVALKLSLIETKEEYDVSHSPPPHQPQMHRIVCESGAVSVKSCKQRQAGLCTHVDQSIQSWQFLHGHLLICILSFYLCSLTSVDVYICLYASECWGTHSWIMYAFNSLLYACESYCMHVNLVVWVCETLRLIYLHKQVLEI